VGDGGVGTDKVVEVRVSRLAADLLGGERCELLRPGGEVVDEDVRLLRRLRVDLDEVELDAERVVLRQLERLRDEGVATE